MTRIRFYSNAPDRLQAAAAWLAIAWTERKPVAVYVPDSELAERFDRMLWTTPATGFLPHCRANSPLATETPIVIAATLDAMTPDRVLLNLGDAVPPDFSRFEDMVEIVSVDDSDRQPARERFRFYREHGYVPENLNAADTL